MNFFFFFGLSHTTPRACYIHNNLTINPKLQIIIDSNLGLSLNLLTNLNVAFFIFCKSEDSGIIEVE